MSRPLATTAVRRRRCVCVNHAGEQEANWPQRARGISIRRGDSIGLDCLARHLLELGLVARA
jgi:hypothetical protein